MGVFRKRDKWWIDYYDPAGRRVRKMIGPNKRVAEAALAKARVEIAEGKYLDKRWKPEESTLKRMADRFMEWSETNKRSWSRDELCIRHLIAFFGSNTPLEELSPFWIEKYKRERLQDVSTRTVNIELACLRNLFNKAIAWGYAASNPVKEVRFFPESPGRLRYLSEEEIDSLLAACPDHFRPVVVVALNTGMRRGEILGLKWADVDFRQGSIYVEKAKNGHSRHVPMSDTVRSELARLRETRATEWVFTTAIGRKRRLKDIRSVWENTLKRAGITDFRFHDIRHTAASHLVMNGVDLKTVQEILGHRTFRMTERYAHLSSQHKARSIKVLDSLFQKPDGHHMDTTTNTLTLDEKRNIE